MTEADPPRIDPVRRSEATGEQLAVLEPLGPMGELNIFSTLAVHPKLMRSWLPFGGRLLQGSSLPARTREVVILRTAARCGSDYEWGQHVAIGLDAGLTEVEIVACSRPTGDHPWSAADRAVLVAVDEVVGDHVISGSTWSQLVDSGLGDSQLIELTMLAGHYAMLAGMLRSVGVLTEGPMPAIGGTEP